MKQPERVLAGFLARPASSNFCGAPAHGKILMPFSSEHRAASGLTGGESIDVELIPDDAPRTVQIQADF